jgi:hypothetical protein
MYYLYNITSQSIQWSSTTPYFVDGKPGVLPDNVIQLVDEYDKYPTNVEPYQIVESYTEIDVKNKILHNRYNIITKFVPDEIPLWAFRSSLLLNGLDGQVTDLIDALPEPQKSVAKIQWEYGNFIVRDHPLIISLSSALGLTTEQVDNVFLTGSLLS